MKKIYIDETKASRCKGYVLATNYAVEEKDAAYVSIQDIVETLQNEANMVAGDLMNQELNPSRGTNLTGVTLLGDGTS